MTRKDFLKGAVAVSTMTSIPAIAADTQSGTELKVRFLGTGAADWCGVDGRGEYRRLSSILVDDRILVDFTPTAANMIPFGKHPDVIFYTHSHSDHYNPDAAIKLGIRQVYVHSSWHAAAYDEFQNAAERLKLPVPEVLPIDFGERKEVFGVIFTSLPANHVARAGERCSMYLIEKSDTRLLYATDTGGIPGEAARIVGIDAHVSPGMPITALIMEATMGIDHTDDFRIFAHSSIATVAQTVRILEKTARYIHPSGRKVFVTHMARTLHGTQQELMLSLPNPLYPAYDGLEVLF